MSNNEQHDDSIREELEHSQLVQDLHSLYDTHAADTQSLARIRSRLLQRASIPLQDKEDDNIITFQTLDTTEKREDATVPFLPSRRLHEWRNTHRHWPRLISEIAALILITALIGSVVLVFSLRPHAPAHNGPQHISSNDQLQQVHMMNAKEGWALTRSKTPNKYTIGTGEAVMRTTDSGQTWYDVTPPQPLTAITSANTPVAGDVTGTTWGLMTDFLSTNIAWVAMTNGPDFAPLFFTTNGGQTWSESSIPASYILQMSFIDAQHGWVMVGSTQASEPDTEVVTLYQTVDSGKTWVEVSGTSSRSLSDTSRGSLPQAGLKTGFTFINAQTGWIVGQTQKTNFFWFYVTHDGGRTWQHQELPHPTIPNSPTGAGPQFQLQPPTFFGNEGILSYLIPTDGNNPTSDANPQGEILEMYMTHDSGQTWQSTQYPLEAGSAIYHTYSIPHFVDANHGTTTLGNIVFFIQRTTDGNEFEAFASHTISFKYRIYGNIVQFNFTSPTNGWILIDNAHPNSAEIDANDPLLLYYTTDGGQTWTQINYAVMGQQVQTSQKINAGWVAVASYSGTGSKVMFLHGQIAPSKQWWLVYSCSGTGYFSAYSPELHFAGDVPSCAANSAAVHSGSAGEIQQNALTPVSIQVQADSSTEWNVLVVECTSSRGCSGSPIG